MKLLYFENKCIGCGACAIACPDFWILSEESGKAILTGSIEKKKGNYYLDIFAEEQHKAEKSKASCPTKAIIIQ